MCYCIARHCFKGIKRIAKELWLNHLHFTVRQGVVYIYTCLYYVLQDFGKELSTFEATVMSAPLTVLFQ